MHWRGYLPVNALPEQEWDTSDHHIVRSGRNGYAVDNRVVEWRNDRTDHLRKEVDELVYMLDFVSDGVPFPKVVNTLHLSYVHPSVAETL